MVSMLRIVFFLLLFLPATYSSAEQTGGCHCFRNRTYDPSDRFAADEYLLTTVFNSLTAHSFSIAKRQIVMLKMKGGVHNDDLLISLYIAGRDGSEPAALLAEKGDRPWRRFLAQNPRAGSVRRDKLYNRILEGLPDAEAAGQITREMLRSRFGVTGEAVNTMLRQDLTLREISLALTLAEHVRTDPAVISSQYRSRGRSWSEIAHNFGLQPADVGKLAGETVQVTTDPLSRHD